MKSNDKKTSHNEPETGTGYSHGFIPTKSIEVTKLNNADELLSAMSQTAFGGRKLGEAADVFYKMITDPDCFVVMTLSGAMTVAKMSLLICDMIDAGMVQAIVSTGALMAHGLVENSGQTHFKYNFDRPDSELYKLGYDRVYDTLELEKNLDYIWEIMSDILDNLDPAVVYDSHTLTRIIGEKLVEQKSGRGVLKSAYDKSVPIYIPAFTDSEFGLELGVHNRLRKKAGQPVLQFNPFTDLDHFAEVILKQKVTGIFTIGGGVPRNWAQQVAPYLDFVRYEVVDERKNYFAKNNDPYVKPYKYAVRICPEPVTWGGLSGCTYSEGVSWGKFFDPKEGGQFAEVPSDATLVWPILIKGVMERLKKNNVIIKKNYNNEEILRSVAV